MTHREKAAAAVRAKESNWPDEDSLLSSESSEGVIEPIPEREDSKPPLSMQPLHAPASSSPVPSANSSTLSSSAKKNKKKKKKKGKKGKKKHSKSKQNSAPIQGPSTSKKHKKNPSTLSRRKVYPIPVGEEEPMFLPDAGPGTSKSALGRRLSIGPSMTSVPANVMAGVGSAEETENAIVMAIREIRRYRERISELEELVRHLSESYGIDPESLLMPESMGASAGSSTVLRKGTRGIRVSVEGVHSTPESSHQGTSDGTDDFSQQVATPSTVHSPTSQMPGVVLPDQSHDRPQLSQEQKMANIMAKLQKLTGRKMSLEEISPLLIARTTDEAIRNGRMLRTAEHLKRVYGGRPEKIVLVPSTTPTPGEKTSPPRVRHQHQRDKEQDKSDGKTGTSDDSSSLSHKEKSRLRKKKSRSVFDFTSLRPIDGEEDENQSAGNTQQTVQPAELVNETTFGLKIEKLSRLTGRRGSLSEIRGLLLPTTVEEAKKYAQSLYTVEKLKKRYGERPAMEQSPQPQQS